MKNVFKLRNFQNVLFDLEADGKSENVQIFIHALKGYFNVKLIYIKHERKIIAISERYPWTHIGFSRCHPSDVFSLRHGVKLAVADMIKETLLTTKNTFKQSIKAMEYDVNNICKSIDSLNKRYKLKKEFRT